MTLGRGLESLIPPHQSKHEAGQAPRQPFGKAEDNEGERQEQEKELKDNFKTNFSFPKRSFSKAPSSAPKPEVRLFKSKEGIGLGPKSTKREEAIFQIEIDKIKPNPHQPRRHFDEESLRELANSIREFGIIQPLVVSKIERESERGWEVEYELVTGERRLLAARMAGLLTVPVIIRQVPVEHEKLELAVTENIQRDDLNPIEFARAVARLQEEFKLTQREIASRLGKSREAVANSIRLLSLPSEMQGALASGKISESQARLLLSLNDLAAREKLFQEILANNLTVREVDLRVRQLREPRDKVPPAPPPVDPEVMALRDELEELLGTKVELKREGRGGKLTIIFYSPEELEAILAKLTKPPHQ